MSEENKISNFSDIFEEIQKAMPETAEVYNFIAVSSPAHPGQPIKYFHRLFKIQGGFADYGSIIKEILAMAPFQYNESTDLVYYLGLPKEVVEKYMHIPKNPTDVDYTTKYEDRSGLSKYMWGKIGRQPRGKPPEGHPYASAEHQDFIPGIAANGPVRHGKKYPLD